MPVPTAPKCRIVEDERREIRPRPFEIGRVGADQQRQLSGRRRVRQAGHGTVDVDETASAQLARHFERMLVRYGGAFDRQRAGLHGRGGAVLGQPHRARCFVVGDHGHDGVGVDRGIFRRRRPSRAARDQVLGFRLAAIPDRDRKSVVEVAAGHAVAHASKTDEGDIFHELVHILDGAGRGAEGALRQRRRHEFVEVAVEHA